MNAAGKVQNKRVKEELHAFHIEFLLCRGQCAEHSKPRQLHTTRDSCDSAEPLPCTYRLLWEN